jgi:hypothetical protein
MVMTNYHPMNLIVYLLVRLPSTLSYSNKQSPCSKRYYQVGSKGKKFESKSEIKYNSLMLYYDDDKLNM